MYAMWWSSPMCDMPFNCTIFLLSIMCQLSNVQYAIETYNTDTKPSAELLLLLASRFSDMDSNRLHMCEGRGAVWGECRSGRNNIEKHGVRNDKSWLLGCLPCLYTLARLELVCLCVIRPVGGGMHGVPSSYPLPKSCGLVGSGHYGTTPELEPPAGAGQ